MTRSHPTSSLDPSAILAEHGMRITDQRRAVLAAMLEEHNDVTAQQLHGRLLQSTPSLGLATVYRTLNALADAGVLDRLHHDADATCFRYCTPGHHHHLTCRACHTVVELRHCDLDDWAFALARRHGFSDVRHALELDGICTRCERSTT